MQITAAVPPALPAGTAPSSAAREAAQAFETLFLTQMLAAAGLGREGGAFGGGAGEAQFASFLVEAQARAMTEAGGIGLTAAVLAAMAERADA